MRRALHLTMAALGALLATSGLASAEQRHHRRATQVADGDRPLTITRRDDPRHGGIYRRGNDIIAPGGFSAHGYGYPAATAEDRRQANNARIREAATGEYAAGNYGFGAFDGGDGFPGAYSNPYYGNSFSPYVGYNGEPTNLAFGPAFANRHLAGHDPADDDPVPGPTPGDLGYRALPDDDD